MNLNELTSWIEANAVFSHSRSSGPGGQNVNKVSTRVTLHIPTAELPLPETEIERICSRLGGRINREGALVVSSEETRSQLQNRKIAVDRAAALISGALRKNKKRRKTKPSRSSVEKRISEKKHRAEIKKMRRL